MDCTLYMILHCNFSILIKLSISSIQFKKKRIKKSAYSKQLESKSNTLFIQKLFHNLYKFVFSLSLDFIFALFQSTITIIQIFP